MKYDNAVVYLYDFSEKENNIHVYEGYLSEMLINGDISNKFCYFSSDIVKFVKVSSSPGVIYRNKVWFLTLDNDAAYKVFQKYYLDLIIREKRRLIGYNNKLKRLRSWWVSCVRRKNK